MKTSVAVESQQVYHRILDMDVGLIETSVQEEQGKSNLRLGFDWLLTAIFRGRRED